LHLCRGSLEVEMPKRSNKFQRLVRLLQHQLADTGVVITESKMVEDRIDGEKAEVDVAVEGVLNGFPLIMGFEVRNTRRRIDRNGAIAIVGKYQRLVDKTIVVSRAGFTRTALKHFKMHGVTPITLADAITVDWGNFFERFRQLFFVVLEIKPDGPPQVHYTGLDQPFRPMTEAPIPILKLPDGQQGPFGSAILPLLRSPEMRDLLMNKWYALPEQERPTSYNERVAFSPNADTPWLSRTRWIHVPD
jgi:hypothetical protein